MHSEGHIDIDLLRAIARGDREAGDLSVLSLAHLLELCPICREAFEAWRRESGEQVAEAPLLAEYEGPIERARERLGKTTSRGKAEQVGARELVQELLDLPPNERLERGRGNPARFAKAAVGDLLLDEAPACLPDRSREAYGLAVLAQAALQPGSGTGRRIEIYARALGHQANALRAHGELRQAECLFQAARFLLKSGGLGDPLTRAELDLFEASLCRDQWRFEEAELLLARTVATYSEEDRPLDAATAVLKLGDVYRMSERLDEAIEIVEQVQEVFEEHGLEHLLLLARHNLAFYCYEAGRIEEARAIFDRAQPLYERFPEPWTQLRRLWLDGHLARAEGDSGAAEAAYRTVWGGFLRQGSGYDAALAALDLAALYAEQSRTTELKRVAEEIVPVFEAQDIHREAAAALLLFRDAVRAEQVTLRYLAELSRYLEEARLDPTLTFRRPD